MNTEELLRECVLGVEFQGGLLLQEACSRSSRASVSWPASMSVVGQIASGIAPAHRADFASSGRSAARAFWSSTARRPDLLRLGQLLGLLAQTTQTV